MEEKWKRHSFGVIKSQSPHWNWAEAYFKCLRFFNTCIIHGSCVMKSFLAWSQLRNVCFVWPHLAGAGRIKVMNMKKSGQNCKCLRLPCFCGEREKRDERVDWANCKCTLLGPKLGNIPRWSYIAELKSRIVNLKREKDSLRSALEHCWRNVNYQLQVLSDKISPEPGKEREWCGVGKVEWGMTD